MEGEQFSLCWNNFHNNLSSGFHSLLQEEDLVDVTLAAGGRYLKAHKTVLSVCSPYFKELFRVNPCKHPIVILQDVNYSALSNLLQFMYQGEVSVSQDEIPNFMKVAEMLKVKGLTENASVDRNGLENNTYSNIPHMYSESKPQMMRRRPVKKLIKPIQHLRPIESLKTARSPPPISPPQPPPPKKPYMENLSSRNEATEPLFHPKEEPVEPLPETTKEQMYEEQVDLPPVLHNAAGGPSLVHHTPVSWKPDLKISTDSSSPGGLVFLKSRKGHPVLIHNGHMYTLSQKHDDSRSTWVCVKQRTLGCDGRVTTTAGPMLLSYSGHNHPQLHDIIQRLQASSCSPSPELL